MFKVMWQFFLLGLYSFGGPAAHIGYFQREFVQNKKWLNDQDFTQAVALCQFLPGPASSQLGMFIGFKRAGYLGALAAFVGFTFPSFLLLTFLAIGNQQYNDVAFIDTVIQAAKLLAVVVVADAMWGMVKKNITSKLTAAVAITTAISVFVTSGLLGQIVPILLAACLGFVISSQKQHNSELSSQPMIKPHLGIVSIFAILLLGLPLLAGKSELLNLINVFYQAGSFVFGGGHVVLPLLEPMMEGMVEPDTFLSAYASAQLVPGPMFTMASYLGASTISESPFIGSLLATIAVFLPGSLLLFAFLPAWSALFKHQRLQESILLVNACVVGLLGSAFIKPVISTSISSVFDVIAVIVGFYLLKYRNIPVWGLIALFVGYQYIM
ncbi:chromate efflux transporter [Photobacterium rosenbergii]|uniref:chromate efflux transporter n=1 Tax=Photobacterium rosenbergii TaxID=294936 RepID=UPI001C9998AF|nr:chromate efflux transporter [Photobacterium rosenbergii]MBY5948283.1 chromate efflux transporter [Photobacterium rosenbergii]